MRSMIILLENRHAGNHIVAFIVWVSPRKRSLVGQAMEWRGMEAVGIPAVAATSLVRPKAGTHPPRWVGCTPGRSWYNGPVWAREAGVVCLF